jgi:hypothetical protein
MPYLITYRSDGSDPWGHTITDTTPVEWLASTEAYEENYLIVNVVELTQEEADSLNA